MMGSLQKYSAWTCTERIGWEISPVPHGKGSWRRAADRSDVVRKYDATFQNQTVDVPAGEAVAETVLAWRRQDRCWTMSTS